jgi:hypothetical protein
MKQSGPVVSRGAPAAVPSIPPTSSG